jgi:hypothetical protein
VPGSERVAQLCGGLGAATAGAVLLVLYLGDRDLTSDAGILTLLLILTLAGVSAALAGATLIALVVRLLRGGPALRPATWALAVVPLLLGALYFSPAGPGARPDLEPLPTIDVPPQPLPAPPALPPPPTPPPVTESR